MLAIAGGILIAVAILGVGLLGLMMLSEKPSAGVTLLVIVACAVAYMVF